MSAHPQACAQFRAEGGYLSETLEPLCGRCGLRQRDHRRRPPRKPQARQRHVFPSPRAPRRRPGAVHALFAPVAVLMLSYPVLMFLAELVRVAP